MTFRSTSTSYKTSEQAHRKYVLPLAVATVLLVLAFFIGASYFISVYAVKKATANSVSIVQFCQSTNDSRANQIKAWNFIIGLGNGKPPPGETKAQHQLEVNRFETFLKKIYAPRDCTVPFNTTK